MRYHYILGNLRLYKLYGNGAKDEEAVRNSTQNLIDHMLSNQVEGIIYIGCHSHVVTNPTNHRNLKFVYSYCLCSDNSVPSVIYNEEKAAYEATLLLLKNPNAILGMITGPTNSIHTTNRIKGFQKALFEKGIPFNPALSLTGDWDRDSGYVLGKELIENGVNSIFAQNDLMAAGVIDYCNNTGINVGSDVHIIGFDNREISSALRPKLSTVELPLFAIGVESANQMFNILHGCSFPKKNILLDCKLIERETT